MFLEQKEDSFNNICLKIESLVRSNKYLDAENYSKEVLENPKIKDNVDVNYWLGRVLYYNEKADEDEIEKTQSKQS